MAKETTLILLGGAGLVAYYGYTQGWFASWGLAPASAVVPTAAANTTTPVTGPTTVVPPNPPTTAVSTSPASSSLSLAAMLAGLQSQIAANPQDPSLVTSGGVTSAVCDVFNFYLVAANVGVTDGMLDCSDHTTQIPLSQYWAWAAPQLQAKIPGLSGLGHIYAGLGQLVKQRKGGW